MKDDMLKETEPQSSEAYNGLQVKVIEHYEGKHITPKTLHSKGMGVCKFCNHIISIDTKFCDKCRNKTSVIVV